MDMQAYTHAMFVVSHIGRCGKMVMTRQSNVRRVSLSYTASINLAILVISRI